MQSIIETLRSGTAKDRLAIVADIVSILGISIAAVLGGLFTLSKHVNVADDVGIAIFSLLSLACVAVVLVVFLAVSGWLGRTFSKNRLYVRLLQFALWSLGLSLFVGAVFIWYDTLSAIQY